MLTISLAAEQMECAQIQVTGGTGTAKPQTYSIPGVYKVGKGCKLVVLVREQHGQCD